MDEDGDPEFMAVVFPPSEHENLHLLPLTPASLSPHSSSSTLNFSSPSSYSSPSSSSSESFSSSDADEGEGDYPRNSERSQIIGVGWLRITIGMILSKVLGKVRFHGGRGDGERGRVFWSIGVVASVLAWVWWLYTRIRFRRRWRRLVRGIRERDERIGQLLNQLAQMNEVLLRKHKELASRLAN